MAKAKRSTPLKKEILEILRQHHLLSAPQIVEKLHQQGLQTNKTSVYRNLTSFLEDDLICQQAFGDEFLYELREKHHDHVVCESCGKVEEIHCPIDIPEQVSGFQVDHHHLVLYGLCQDCQKKQRA